MRLIHLLFALPLSNAFLLNGIPSRMASGVSSQFSPASRWAESTPPSRAQVSPSSYLEDNDVALSPQDLEIMDQMIAKFAQADPKDWPAAMNKAFRVVSSPPFFLRIAEQADKTEDAQERAKLQQLSLFLTESTAEWKAKLEQRSKTLQDLLTVGAEPETGEFYVPMTSEQVDALQNALQSLHPQKDLDELFLQTLDGWMTKCQKDPSVKGMLSILQKLLQLVCGIHARQLSQSAMLSRFLWLDPSAWDEELNKLSSNERTVLRSQLHSVTQKVLNLPQGSFTQRYLSQYIRELYHRAQKASLH